MSEESQSREGPLSGLKVVEMGQLLAGPFCGQLLGDMGADVVKIEDPGRGDPMRQWGRTLPEGESLWFSIVGRNKRSVTVNLRTEAGQRLARQLIGQADVLVENFRPGTLEKWNLGYEQLAVENPALIMVRVSGFGQDGPYSSQAGYGAIGEAMGGLRYVTGSPDQPPARVGISIGDTLAAVFATIGALSALHERERSGLGQVVDSAIYEAVLGVMESIIPEWAISGYQRERSGAILPNIAPSNVYPTRDGEWILIAANQDTVFARLASAMGDPDLAMSDAYRTHHGRGANQTALDVLIANFSIKHDATDLDDLLTQHGVPHGKIFRPEDMLKDGHYLARKSIIDVEHPRLGKVPMQNVFPRLSRSPGAVKWPGPALGEHTDAVLKEIGLPVDDIDALRAARVI